MISECFDIESPFTFNVEVRNFDHDIEVASCYDDFIEVFSNIEGHSDLSESSGFLAPPISEFYPISEFPMSGFADIRVLTHDIRHPHIGMIPTSEHRYSDIDPNVRAHR